MNDLFLLVLSRSVAVLPLIGAVMALRLVLKSVPRWTICLLWALVGLRLVCPSFPESPFSVASDAAGNQLMIQWADAYGELASPTPTGAAAFVTIDAGDDESFAYTVPDNPQAWSATLVPVLAWLWLAGMGGTLLWGAADYLFLKRKVRASLPSSGYWVCDDIPAPCVLGLFRPRIYLPSGLPEDQIPLILAHERSHLRRGDPWWKLLGFTVVCVYWFHPLVWAGYVLFCRDIELACDEKAVARLDQNRRASYSRAMLECAMGYRSFRVSPLAFGEIGVKERVKRVLNYRKPKFWALIAGLLVCCALALFFLTSPRGTSGAAGVTGEYSLTIGAEGITGVEVSTPNESCFFSPGEAGVFSKGEELRLEVLDHLDSLEGVNISAMTGGEEYNVVYTLYVPEGGGPATLHATQGDCWALTRNGVPLTQGTPVTWVDFWEEPGSYAGQDITTEVDFFPGFSFRYTPECVWLISPDGTETLVLAGMPIFNCFFADITGDGLPELCATVAMGSGIIDTRVVVCDCVSGKNYELEDRGTWDYVLSAQDGVLVVSRYAYPQSGADVPESSGMLSISPEGTLTMNELPDSIAAQDGLVESWSQLCSGFSFLSMEAGEQIFFSNPVEFSQDGGVFSFLASYDWSGNALEVGLLSQTGEELCLTVFEPNQEYRQITGIPAGTYQVFVRNPLSNEPEEPWPDYLDLISGAVIFTLSGGSIVLSPEA